MRHAGLQRRLLLILGAAALAVTIGSAVALLAMIDIGREFDAVTRSELPETTTALRIARIGERIQSRAPALVVIVDPARRFIEQVPRAASPAGAAPAGDAETDA